MVHSPHVGLEVFEPSLERTRFAKAGFTTSYGRVAEQIYRALLFNGPDDWRLSLLTQCPWHSRPDEQAMFVSRRVDTAKYFVPPPLPIIQGSVGRHWRLAQTRREYLPKTRAKRFDLLSFTSQFPWGAAPLAPAEVYAIMDLYYARFYPENFRDELEQLRARLDSLWLICISSYTAADAVEFLGIPPERARAIPLAVDHAVYCPEPADDDVAIRARYGLPERYVLYVGNFYPRKNVLTLARALECANEDLTEPIPLVLAGYLGATNRLLRYRTNREFARLLRRTPRYEVDQPTDHEMASIYRGATMVVHPSLFEGFGFTVLEAQACGTPVICGRHSSLTEVGGHAAYFLDDVRDVEAMAGAIRKVLDSDTLRTGMRTRGLAHAAKFTWERFGKDVLAFHQEALASVTSA